MSSEQSAGSSTYWGFISYSRHDARVAEELRARLMKQVVPPVARSRVTRGSRHFRPIFLDTEEVAASRSLSAGLQAALRQSSKLIVVCSPFAANSAYVSDEIRYFQSLGRDADILCVIASGVPGASATSQPALECFPPPLRAHPAATAGGGDNPLAPALNKESRRDWKRVLEQLTAGMLGVSLEEQRRIAKLGGLRRLAAWSSGATALAAVAAVAAWIFLWPHVTYSKGYVRKWGAWTEVDTIPERVARKRDQSFRFVRHGLFGRVDEVLSVDQDGRCIGEGMRSITGNNFSFTCSNAHACGARFSYSGKQIRQEKVFDQYGQTIETLDYPDLPDVALLAEAVVGCSRREGNIETVELQRWPAGPSQGLDRKVLFKGGDNKEPRPNGDYGFGLQYDYDANGRTIRETLLDPDGMPRLGAQGYATQAARYSSRGDLVESRSLDLKDQPVEGAAGYARLVLQRDEYGNNVGWRYFDADGHPTFDLHGVHGGKIERSPATGRQSRRLFVDTDGHPTFNSEGVSSIAYVHTNQPGSNERVEHESYFDEAGHPVTSAKNSCASQEIRIDADETVIDDLCFGIDGRPAYSSSGAHLQRGEFDTKGQKLSARYFDKDGTTAINCSDAEEGCPTHAMRNTFDARGNVTQQRTYGVDGALNVNSLGLAGVDMVYNQRNQEVRRTYIGIDGRHTVNLAGYGGEAYAYDSYGRQNDVQAISLTGDPAADQYGVHGRRIAFDAHGNAAQVSFRGLDGKPAKFKGQYATTTSLFDAAGRKIEEKFLGIDGQPATDDSGAFGYRYLLDRWGNAGEYRMLGRDGTSSSLPPGRVAVVANDRDRFGHVVRKRFLGPDRSPTAGPEGVAGWTDRLDARGRVVLRRFFDVAGQPALSRKNSAGYRYAYDERGNQTLAAPLGLHGEIVDGFGTPGTAITISQYDELNRLKYQFTFDRFGRPSVDKEGVHGLAYAYDDHGRDVEETNLAIDGRMFESTSGWSHSQIAYDRIGAMTEVRFYGIDGTLSRGLQNATIKYVNDSSGRTLERSFFDARGKLIVNGMSGRARIVYRRDAFGRIVEELSYDAAGRPVNRSDVKWFRRTQRYETGVLAEVQCFDTAGKPVTPCNENQ